MQRTLKSVLRAKVVLLFIFAVKFMLLPVDAQADDPNDILIIVNKRIDVKDFDLEITRQIFLKVRKRWNDGQKMVPVHAKEGTSLRKTFLSRIMKMSPAVETAYWRDKKIKVGVSKPPEFSNVQKAVFSLRGSISYVYRSQYIEGVVKTVLVVPAK
jgi:ABC-type phosphate transport system substrate-binding protein